MEAGIRKFIRLGAYLARAGVTSRRKAVLLVRSGTVAIDGQVVREPWREVMPSGLVTVDGVAVCKERLVYILMSKLRGNVTTCDDEQGRSTVLEQLGTSVEQRVYPVGRLDINTTGLLLCTNDGDLAHRLMHPKFEVEKTYRVMLDRPLIPSDLARVQSGVMLEDGLVTVDSVRMMGNDDGARDETGSRMIELILHSGRYRVIRRLFQALGYNVRMLDRTRYGGLTKRGLTVGAWRYLTPGEVAALRRGEKVKQRSDRRSR